MAIFRCARCSTRWSTIEQSGEFLIRRISIPPPEPSIFAYLARGCQYSWVWTESPPGCAPGSEKLVAFEGRVSVSPSTPPTSAGCSCINTCWGSQSRASLINTEEQTVSDYIYIYRGFWNLKSQGRYGGCPRTINGRVNAKFRRVFRFKKYKVDYIHNHLCGRFCPPCYGNFPGFRDTKNQFIAIYRNSPVKC